MEESTHRYMKVLLADLSDSESEQVRLAFQPVRFTAGARLVEQGEYQDWLYFVELGRVSVSLRNNCGQETRFGSLGAGDEIGFTTFGDERSPVTITALEVLTVFRCSKYTLDHLMQSVPRFGANVGRILCRRIGHLENQISSFSAASGRDR